jgi:hypothetical protein
MTGESRRGLLGCAVSSRGRLVRLLKEWLLIIGKLLGHETSKEREREPCDG